MTEKDAKAYVDKNKAIIEKYTDQTIKAVETANAEWGIVSVKKETVKVE